MTDPTNEQTEPESYGTALAELESILEGLESRAVDVDRLAADVQRAALLITHCRDRLAAVQTDVEDIVTDLEASESPEDPAAGANE